MDRLVELALEEEHKSTVNNNSNLKPVNRKHQRKKDERRKELELRELEKDPEYPQRPHSVHYFFRKAHYKKMKRKYPDASERKIKILLRKKWTETTSWWRRKYITLAYKERKEYEKKVEVYKAQKAREAESLEIEMLFVEN